MDQPKRFFDLWFVQANNVIKEVPFHVVTDWLQQGRATGDDRVKPSGTADWVPLGSVIAFQPYLLQLVPIRAEDPAEALEPVEMDFDWKRREGEEDDDVDMIPLIDISLVLLIFFMMTTTVSALSRIMVPPMSHVSTIDTNPGVIRIDIDLRDGDRVYSIGLGNQAPTPDDDNLRSEDQLKERLTARLEVVTEPPKVRIAAHQDVPYKYVEEVMKSLESKKSLNQIREYTVEVNERARP
ncbi:MAG TPA: biopolymer transporter ExbD [Gemmataceae bacterium]|jgi:biopolymer transport protein ExbD|nr:biopolymer transporter ExbD [Gemmataceae bacterium]